MVHGCFISIDLTRPDGMQTTGCSRSTRGNRWAALAALDFEGPIGQTPANDKRYPTELQAGAERLSPHAALSPRAMPTLRVQVLLLILPLAIFLLGLYLTHAGRLHRANRPLLWIGPGYVPVSYTHLRAHET